MAAGKKTGGRKKGSQNKARAERIAMAAASGMLPHEFLLAVARGERFPTGASFIDPTFDQRIDAAKAAAPFYAPKLTAVEHTGKDGGPIETREYTDMDRAKALAFLFGRLQK